MVRRTDLGLPVQALALRNLAPSSTVLLSPRRLIWRAQIQPSIQSQTYELCLQAEPGRTPTVRVVAPQLRADEEGRLPHVYEDGSLCLSRFGDWRPHMLFTDTFLAWACEWLVYYELWLATKVWYGDGPDQLDPESQKEMLHPYG